MENKDYDFFRKQLATPEILPCPFDVTFNGWLARIELWGLVTIEFKNNTDQKKWKRINRKDFIKQIYDDKYFKIFGKWKTEKLHFNSMRFFRYYLDKEGNKGIEQFRIKVDIGKF